MKRDLRFAIRMLLKQPGFSLIAILTLALGIGVTSAVFSLIQGVLLTPPPYKKPQQLVLVQSARTDGQKEANPRGWPSQQWMEWQKEAKSFEGLAGYSWPFNFLIRNGGSQSIQGMIAGGVFVGLVLAIVLSRVLRTFLFEVKPNDPMTLVVVGALFAGVAMLACWAPVRRAVKVDPLEAFRYE